MGNSIAKNSILFISNKVNKLVSFAANILRNRTVLLLMIIVGFVIKLLLFPAKLGDYNYYLEPWVNFIKINGYFSALKYDFYNYTPAYIYILIIIAKLGFNTLYSIKFVSVIFEYVLVYYAGKIVNLKYNNHKIILLSLAIIPLLPTIMLNSAFWGQCDSIYSAFVVMSVYYVLKKKNLLSVLLLAIAFAFKAQAAFILPFFFILMLKRQIKWYYFTLIPLIYVISVIPVWFMGRDLKELLTIYGMQSSYFRGLTVFFPNIYVWINNINDTHFELVRNLGLLTTLLFVLSFCFWLIKQNIVYSLDVLIRLVLLFVVLLPFLLPGMHERYLYLGDIFSILFYFLLKKRIYVPLGILTVSFYSYVACSRLKTILPLWPAFFIYLTIIIIIIYDLVKTIKEQKDENCK